MGFGSTKSLNGQGRHMDPPEDVRRGAFVVNTEVLGWVRAILMIFIKTVLRRAHSLRIREAHELLAILYLFEGFDALL